MNLDFERVYSEYAAVVYRIGFLYFRDASAAEDVVQDCFVKLMTKRPDFKGEGHLKAWLITVARNECRTLSRRGRRQQPLDENIPFVPAEREVLAGIMLLPELDRTAVYLHYYEGYASKEIAAILRVTDGAVRARLKRARAQLRTILG